MRTSLLAVSALSLASVTSARLVPVWIQDMSSFEVNDVGVMSHVYGGMGAVTGVESGNWGMGMGIADGTLYGSAAATAAMAYDQSALAQYTANMKDVRTAQPIYAAPLTNTQAIIQPIIKPKLVHQPIIQTQVVKQPILHTHYVNQPVLRSIYTQPVIHPHMIETTTVQPELTQQPVLQPKILDQTIVQPKLEESFLQNQPIVSSPTLETQTPLVQQQIRSANPTRVQQAIYQVLPEIHNAMIGHFSEPVVAATQHNAAITTAETQITNSPILQQLPTVVQPTLTKDNNQHFNMQ